MRIKFLIFCSCVSLLFQQQVYAQASSASPLMDIPHVIPPSPNAASLGKYGDVNVGEYTGAPSIGIPLYTITLGKYLLPITMNYTSSGLKVEEKSNWVGLGWSLSAGGVITRSMHGKPDEGGSGYWSVGNWSDAQILGPSPYLYSPAWSGGYDLEPDIFYFNFAGRSGKFVMDANDGHNAHCIPFQNLQIQHDNSLNGFTITDSEGNIYTFDVKETTNNESVSFVSAWYLSKITTPAGIINFTYNGNNEFNSSVQRSQIDFTRATGNVSADKNGSSNVSSIETNGNVLQQITAPGVAINFNVSRNRKDIPQCSQLDNITIQDGQGQLRKQFTFDHSYFGNTASTRADDVRLKLDNIKEVSVNNDGQVKTHTFTYYSPEQVPALDSKAQDYWGFYNGYANGTLLVGADPIDYPQISKVVGGANREPVADNAVVGTLKTVIYPTGGTTTFIYEGNDYGFISGTPLNETEKVKNSVVASAARSSSVNVPVNTKTFSISGSQNVGIQTSGSYTGPAPVENGPSVVINLVNSDGSRTNKYSKIMINSTNMDYVFLGQGNYELTASVDGTGQNATGTVYFTTPGNIIKTKKGGGVRIKQIINTDAITGNQNMKNYTYVMKDDPSRSSGDIMSDFKFIEFQYGYMVRTSYTANYLSTTQGSTIGYKLVTSLEVTNGGTVNGTKESYYATAPTDLYGQNYELTNGTLSPTSLSYKTLTDFDVYRGNLSRQAIYNAQGILIKESLSNYNIDANLNGTVPNYLELSLKKGYMFAVCPSGCSDCSIGTSCNGSHFYCILTKAKVLCPWIYKTSTTDRTYDINGQNATEVTTSFYYDNPVHAQVTRTETVNSKNQTISTTNKYPQDNITNLSSTAEAARQSLIQSHIISPMLEQTITNNGNLVKYTQTDYRNWTATVIEPEIITVQNGAGAAEKRIQFYNYDNWANILEQGKTSDTHEVYLWGYNSQYPVAKILGSSYNEVIQYVNQDVLTNTGNYSPDQVRTALNNIRVNLPKALVTTYTYIPLLGISSETDPSGKTTYYEYDGLGRLKLIRDLNNNIIKRFDYQYQAQ